MDRRLNATYMGRCGLMRLSVTAVEKDGTLELEGDHALELQKVTQLIVASTPAVKIVVSAECIEELSDGGMRTHARPLALSAEQRMVLGLALRDEPDESTSQAPPRRRRGSGVTLAPTRPRRWVRRVLHGAVATVAGAVVFAVF